MPLGCGKAGRSTVRDCRAPNHDDKHYVATTAVSRAARPEAPGMMWMVVEFALLPGELKLRVKHTGTANAGAASASANVASSKQRVVVARPRVSAVSPVVPQFATFRNCLPYPECTALRRIALSMNTFYDKDIHLTNGKKTSGHDWIYRFFKQLSLKITSESQPL
jgi:hypothetical protein